MSYVKTRTWDQDTPNDGNYFDDEFDNIYSGLNDLDSKVSALQTTKVSGIIDGGLKFKSTSLPPTIRAGSYGVNGVVVDLDADLDLALSDVTRVNPAAAGKTSNALDSNMWYGVYLDQSGNGYYSHYSEKSVRTGTVSGISGSGTTKTVTVNSAGSDTKKVLIVKDANGFLFSGKITGGNGSTTYTVETLTGTITPSGSVTFEVQERLASLHGSGSSVAITIDGDINKYSPACGLNGWDAGISGYNAAKNGIYNLQTGVTGLRMIGAFCTDNSANVIQDSIISFKNGDNKNDNKFSFYTYAGFGSGGASNHPYFAILEYCRGNDYLIKNNSTDAFVVSSFYIGELKMTGHWNQGALIVKDNNIAYASNDFTSQCIAASFANSQISADTVLIPGENVFYTTLNASPGNEAETRGIFTRL